MREQDRSGNESEKPMIVFAGRSNVGKSSTIRALTGKKVRVGKRPGSTRWEQMIELGPVILVDIPGFGFMAGQSKETIEVTKTSIIQNLENWSDRLALTVLIIDVSLFRELVERWEMRGEVPIDIEFYSFLTEISPEVVVVANKIDKIKKRQQQGELDYMKMRLMEAVHEVEPRIVVTSAKKRQGTKELKTTIEHSLSSRNLALPEWR
ncbi:MAG: GTP-binding protein EngB [Candidatus Thorarchaeota archaeon]|jgi:GTP-binding protein EngB required for normal cell division